MNNLFFGLFFLLLCYSASAQYEDKNNALDVFIKKGMADWEIPGMVTVVVHKGKVVFQKAYGVKDKRTKTPVDKHSMFSMASTTKAVVAIALGMLVDEGKLKWDDKVVQHLPDFKLDDIYTTSQARVVDLLTHNLGIKNTDKIWVWDSLSTPEAMKRYSHAKTVYPLRGGFSYQNMMYIVAGEVITRVSGMDWTQFIQSRIFEPLKMNHSAAKAEDILKLNNYVTPHVDDYEDGIIPVHLNFTQQVGSAGALWSCVEDMGKYMAFLTNKGVAGKDTLLQPETFNYLFKSHVVVSPTAYSTWSLFKPNFHTYGLGWFQHDFRGEKLDFHTGSLAGLVAIAGIMHRKQTAVYFFANKGSANLRHAIMYKVMDLYAFNDSKGRDWHKDIFNIYSASHKRSVNRQKKKDKAQIEGTTPTHELKQYTGTYSNEMFGKIQVSLNDGKLSFNLNKYTFFDLSHWHYNTFRSTKHPEWRYRVFLNFQLNTKGEINLVQYKGPYINLDFIKL